MSQNSIKSDHSVEADFMNEVSFDLDDPTNPDYLPLQNAFNLPKDAKYSPQSNYNPNPKYQNLNYNPNPLPKKPVSKISLNLKPKLMAQEENETPEEFPMREEPIKESNGADKHDEMMVPEFLLGNRPVKEGGNSTAAIMRQVFPNRYFILKKLSKGQLEICMDMNYCVVLMAYKRKLHDAYQVIPNLVMYQFIFIGLSMVFVCKAVYIIIELVFFVWNKLNDNIYKFNH